jgi:hypothetical protein
VDYQTKSVPCEAHSYVVPYTLPNWNNEHLAMLNT